MRIYNFVIRASKITMKLAKFSWNLTCEFQEGRPIGNRLSTQNCLTTNCTEYSQQQKGDESHSLFFAEKITWKFQIFA